MIADGAARPSVKAAGPTGEGQLDRLSAGAPAPEAVQRGGRPEQTDDRHTRRAREVQRFVACAAPGASASAVREAGVGRVIQGKGATATPAASA